MNTDLSCCFTPTRTPLLQRDICFCVLHHQKSWGSPVPILEGHLLKLSVHQSIAVPGCSHILGAGHPGLPFQMAPLSPTCTCQRGCIEFLGAHPYLCKDVIQQCLTCHDLHQQRKSTRKMYSELKFQVFFFFQTYCSLLAVGLLCSSLCGPPHPGGFSSSVLLSPPGATGESSRYTSRCSPALGTKESEIFPLWEHIWNG